MLTELKRGGEVRMRTIAAYPPKLKNPIAIVADCMGGHRAGNIASCIAVESIVKYVETSTITNTRMLLQHAISYANKQIFDAAQQDESCAGMGTTVVMAYVRPAKVHLCKRGRQPTLSF